MSVQVSSSRVLEENLDYTTGLFVDEPRDTFDATSTSNSTDGGLRDTLDVVSQGNTVTLSLN